MKIIFFGTPQEVVPVLENLSKHYEVVAVVTSPDKKVGRKQILTPPPVKVFAQQHNIPVLQPETLKETSHLSLPTSHLYVVSAYGKIIPHNILKLPKHGAINIHPSMLPKYRGATPIQSALLNGDKESGISFMLMDEQMDHGPILHQTPFSISPTDTFGGLMQSKFAQAANLLPHIIEEYIAGKLKPQPQNETHATYTKIITKVDGYIDLDSPPTPEVFNNMVRAFYPWPTVWTKTRIKSKAAKGVPRQGRESRIKFLPNKTLQMEGKQPVSLKDFLNGYPELAEKIKTLYK